MAKTTATKKATTAAIVGANVVNQDADRCIIDIAFQGSAHWSEDAARAHEFIAAWYRARNTVLGCCYVEERGSGFTVRIESDEKGFAGAVAAVAKMGIPTTGITAPKKVSR